MFTHCLASAANPRIHSLERSLEPTHHSHSLTTVTQLYVALSRVTDVRKMAALLPLMGIQTTVNIVYPEILLKVNIYILQLAHTTNCYTIGIEYKQTQLQPATIMSGEGDTE